MQIKADSLTLDITDLEYHSYETGETRCDYFVELTVNGVLTLTLEDLKDLPDKVANPIWEALHLAAQEAKRDWERECALLRDFLRDQREGDKGYIATRFYC